MYKEVDLRRELIRKHGAKLEFLFTEGVDKKILEFKVERLHLGRRFDGTAKGAYVDGGAPDLATAADWALDALRKWAGISREDIFAEISREWAKNGEGKFDVPASLGSTIDWLYLFSADSSNSLARRLMYAVNGPGLGADGSIAKWIGNAKNVHLPRDLFALYMWIFADMWDEGGHLNTHVVHKPSNMGLNKSFWDISDINYGNSDQTHHFAGYFWFGAKYGTSDFLLKRALAHTKDYIKDTDTVTNPGDVDLGILAAQWGDYMKHHRGYIGKDVERSLRVPPARLRRSTGWE